MLQDNCRLPPHLNSILQFVNSVQTLESRLDEPKSLQTSVSKTGARAESFLVSLLVL